MEKIAVLLNGSIADDGRVQRSIRVMLNYFEVDLFYLNGTYKDRNLFKNGKINLISGVYDHNKNGWFRKNFLIHNWYDFFEERIETDTFVRSGCMKELITEVTYVA